ncbi:MAG: mechanosensitive ion channel family protein [Candidatus Bathyarchaeota archaeon]|nr:mechanosensitive ion channel family protein [Candidatus Termiticorpusculum sp.]
MSLDETVTNASAIASLSSTIQKTLNISATSAEILVSTLIFIIIGLAGLVSYTIINKYVNRWTAKTATNLDDKIAKAMKTVMIILIGILVIRFSVSPLSFLKPYNYVLDSLFLIIQILLAAYAISKVAKIFIDQIADVTTQKSGKNNKHATFVIKQVITAIIFIIAALTITNLLGLTGLWQSIATNATISGIILAFALQSTLSDLFSAIYVYIDRPFEIGDYIYINEHSGTVKNIGILTTRLQLLQGEELVVSNKELSTIYIRNFRKLQKRRIVFNIGVNYDTPNEKLKKISPMITEIIKNVKGASPQFVKFNEFGEYSLKFFISYFVHAPDYGSYLEVQQEINLAIREAFEKEGIEMAYLKNVTYLKR